MINKPRKQRLIAEINITPFTDVILVLLIIFMITTPLIIQSSIRVDLPKAASAQPLSGQNQAYITLSNENVTYLNNEVVTRKELKERISKLYKNNAELGVILQSDKLVRFKDIVNILDILKDIGVRNLDIAATAE